ncbi:unnamed protein product [Tuber aestivum]|uniref:Uncharacterized protein n=1 Tax=Tuber aestivum TaxID=59557 RepID=A0A292PS69_9PEZI|nr:unnamed protein product [Tuber aestivum]
MKIPQRPTPALGRVERSLQRRRDLELISLLQHHLRSLSGDRPPPCSGGRPEQDPRSRMTSSRNPPQRVQTNWALFTALGVDVAITEFDVRKRLPADTEKLEQ